MAKKAPSLMETIVSLCKRRGFIFQASEIYGGMGNTYDYGPLGVELMRRTKEAWWNSMVTEPRLVGNCLQSVPMLPPAPHLAPPALLKLPAWNSYPILR